MKQTRILGVPLKPPRKLAEWRERVWPASAPRCDYCGKRRLTYQAKIGENNDRLCRECVLEYIPPVPLCVREMGCLCAGHARGNPPSAPCDTSET